MKPLMQISFPFRPRVNRRVHKSAKPADVLAFFRQLATLFNAGTPIHEAISISASQCQSTVLRHVVQRVADQVAAGTPLCDALNAHGKLFKPAWVEVIRSGESSGQLGQVLSQLCDRIDKSQQMRAKIVSALTYPAILACVSIGAVAVMLVKVVPTFQQMFEQMDQELPGITVFIVGLSDFLQAHGLQMLLGIAVSAAVISNWARGRVGRPIMDSLLLALPLIGDMGVQVAMQRFAGNMSMSLRAGLSLLDALDGVQGAMGNNLVYQQAVQRVGQQISQGERFGDALQSSGTFPAFVVRMVAVGERSGTLPEVLQEIETFYERQVETTVSRLMSSLETALVLFMGGAVAVILSSVYLPMFSMASGVG
ncbi:MAG: phytochrome sensor protein [Planctomycetota bacterium]|nr:MAG: phytochrome sensor protein [Planctomycetota bacterium]